MKMQTVLAASGGQFPNHQQNLRPKLENKNEYIITQLSQKSNNQLPIIKIIVGNMDIPALLDSGASCSLLSLDTFNKIKSLIKIKYLSKSVTIKAVSGENVNFIFCTEFTFKILNKNFRHLFFVTKFPPHSQYKALLGFEWLNKNHLIMDLHSNVLKSESIEIPIAYTNCDAINSMENFIEAKLAQKVILKKNESKIVTIKINQKLPENTEILFQPKYLKQDVMIHTSFNKIDKNNNTHIIVTNLSQSQTQLNKKMKIGFIDTDYELNDIKQPNHSVNLITADENIVELRKKQLAITDFNLKHLQHKQKQELGSLLMDYSDVFSKCLRTLGHTDLLSPKINLTHNHAISCKPYPIPESLRKQAKFQLDELKEANIITETTSDYASPLILVRKRDSTKLRLTIDFRLLNSFSNFYPYPLPLISDIFNDLAGFRYYTTLDLHSAFHQVELAESERCKTGFCSTYGNYHFNRLPYGLKSAGTYFQKLMNTVLGDLHEMGIIPYIDDICIGANSFEETLDKIKIVFNRLRKYNLTLSPSKCDFFQTKVTYLGFEVSENGVTPTDHNINKITSFPIPNTVRKIKRFLGLCNFYRTLIKDHASLTEPLVQLTRKGIPFKWSPKCDEAFKELQNIILQKPILIRPKFQERFYLNVDASKISISGVLLQKRGDLLLPVSYFSRKVKDFEQKYSATELETFALHESLKHYFNYLFGREFTVISDHRPLKHLMKLTNPANRITRWLLYIQQFTFTFQYIKGEQNVIADYFSREVFNENSNKVENINCDPNLQEENYSINTGEISKRISLPTMENIFQAQLEDDNLLFIRQSVAQSQNIYYNNNTNTKKYKGYDNFYIDSNSGLLMHIASRNKRAPRKDLLNQIVIPKSIMKDILKGIHICHFGVQKTFELFTEKYFAFNQFSDIKNYVLSCQKCLSRKARRNVPAPFENVPLGKHPNDFISGDIVGPLRTSSNNSKYIFTIIDHFSKYIELYPISNIRAETIADCLLQWITTYGCPNKFLSDRGKQFTSNIFKELTNKMSIKTILTTSYHPETNAQSEIINKSLKNTISILSENKHNWHEYVCFHKLFFNSSQHSATLEKPSFLFLSRDIQLPIDILQKPEDEEFLDYSTYSNVKIQNMKEIYNKVYYNLEQTQLKQNERHLKKAQCKHLKVGDLVYISNPILTHALSNKYSGPFRVTDIPSKVNVMLIKPENPRGKSFRIHINRVFAFPTRRPHLIDKQKNDHTRESSNDEDFVHIGEYPDMPTYFTTTNVSENFTTTLDKDNLQNEQSIRTPEHLKQDDTQPNNAIVKPPHSYNLRERK